MKFRHPKRQLVPAEEREAYGQRVLAWTQAALDRYGPENVRKAGYRWTADDDRPVVFSFGLPGYSIELRLAKPSDLLTGCRSHAKARQKILSIATELMREARTADERELQQLKRARKVGAL